MIMNQWYIDFLAHLSTHNLAYDVVLKALALIVSIIGAYYFYRVYRTDVRYRRRKLADEILGQIYDSKYDTDAMKMLEYPRRKVMLEDGKWVLITHDRIRMALKRGSLEGLTEIDIHIRDCMDHLLSSFIVIDQAVTEKLVDEVQLEYPTYYYMRLLSACCAEEIVTYANSTGMSRAVDFMDRAHREGKLRMNIIR